ncbi:hypothetical protein Tsubulata_020993 [Turnera subulata]|uniref:RING-type E3 ubiquitin transferase n=1 Tax=Turnera subulata TaxID=218843 RepID=A0A9Q0J3I4_9ROSI|nr:hypothetical protein Tsubulata_020993 [Turnera subulata]
MKSKITFIVGSDSKHTQKFMDHQTNVDLGERGVPILAPKLEIHEEDFMASGSNEEASSQISSLVDSLDIDPDDKQEILYGIARSVRSALRVAAKHAAAGEKSREWMVKLGLRLETTYWWKDMVPASNGSISGLEKGRVVEFSDEDFHEEKSCCICFKEFQEDGLVKRMPCSHIFDDKCIDEWLSKSRYCPICRYEMPPSLCLISPREDLC